MCGNEKRRNKNNSQNWHIVSYIANEVRNSKFTLEEILSVEHFSQFKFELIFTKQ